LVEQATIPTRKCACKETEREQWNYRKARISPNQKSGKQGSAHMRKAPVTMYLPAPGTIKNQNSLLQAKPKASTEVPEVDGAQCNSSSTQ